MAVESSVRASSSGYAPHGFFIPDNLTATTTVRNLDAEKAAEREAFYATYDVWTGVRTAITLFLFFLFTVTVIVYKSKCKRHRHYELYPSLEDIPERPLEYYPSDYWGPAFIGIGDNISNESRKMDSQEILRRMYEGNQTDNLGSAPLPIHIQGGSYMSLNNSFKIKSLPGSVMRVNLSRMDSLEKDEMSQYAVRSCRSEYLRVPGVRLQSTGSSSDGYSIGSSSYDMAYESPTMTHLGVPGSTNRNRPSLQLGGIDWNSDSATAEWLQTIDINVIQPTPNVSPCGSVRSVSEYEAGCKLGVPGRKRSDSNSTFSGESKDFDTNSFDSDSVFEESLYDNVSISSEVGRIPYDVPSGSKAPVIAKTPNQTKRKVQSVRLPINAAASSTPLPNFLQGRLPRFPLNIPTANDGNIPTTCLGLPAAVNLSASCERLAAHETLLMESQESMSQEASLPSLRASGSFEEPVVRTFSVPHIRRTNSATNPEPPTETHHPQVRRTESAATPSVRRADSAEYRRQNSSGSSSGSDDISDSVSFHLMVPHLSFDCPSAETSRASSPTVSESPPGSPAFGSSLGVPTHHFPRSVSPSRNRFRIGNIYNRGNDNKNLGARGTESKSLQGKSESRGILRRQYSQCIPSSPREKPPSPFGLPTSFEEEEEYVEENVKDSNGEET